jgi:hypothetical protein
MTARTWKSLRRIRGYEHVIPYQVLQCRLRQRFDWQSYRAHAKLCQGIIQRDR